MSVNQDTPDAVTVLDEAACWERLAGQELGRLIVRVGETVDVFPVNYVVQDRSVVLRTAEGTKLFALTVNGDVVFEVDDHTDEDAWSVVLHGRAEHVQDADAEAALERLPLRPWIPTRKSNLVRIHPRTVSGRAFVRGPEPEWTAHSS